MTINDCTRSPAFQHLQIYIYKNSSKHFSEHEHEHAQWLFGHKKKFFFLLLLVDLFVFLLLLLLLLLSAGNVTTIAPAGSPPHGIFVLYYVFIR